MFYLYILKSLVVDRKYIGITGNVENRLREHNNKKVRSTKAYAPWRLALTEEYVAKTEARKREIELKRNFWKRNELFKNIK